MSYCVNCGVELAPSERACPLCDTPVLNPASPWTEPPQMPYPHRVERIMRRIDRRYGAALCSLVLLIPAMITLLVDLLANGQLNWSPYVIGALLIVFVFALVPWYFDRPRYLLYIALDAAAVLLYLAYISAKTANFAWFFPLGAPLTLIVAALAAGCVVSLRARGISGLYRPAAMLCCVAIACVLVELCIDLYFCGSFRPIWSPLAAAPMLVLAAMLLLIEKKQSLKDKIRRRLFL